MGIDNIFSEWGIHIPVDQDKFEYLFLSEPEKCFYIDRFPLLINDFKKFEQQEISYDKVVSHETPLDIFKAEEIKYMNIIKKLWLYNQIIVETDFLQVDDKTLKNLLENENDITSLRNTLQQTQDNIVLENSNYLDLLIRLGTKEKVYSTLVLLDFKMVVSLYGTCFPVYFKDISKVQLIKEIACTEGLYLRPYLQIGG
ncbi:MAG: hypothetical protein ACYDEJ_04810 [Desulfitobacteriaceae bacterium]